MVLKNIVAVLILSQISPIYYGVIGVALGLVFGVIGLKLLVGVTIKNARTHAVKIRESAVQESESILKKRKLDGDEYAKRRKRELDEELRNARSELSKDRKRIEKREQKIDSQLDRLGKQEERLESRQRNLDKKTATLEQSIIDIEQNKENLLKRLEDVAGMGREEAKLSIREEVEEDARQEAVSLEREIIEKAELDAKSKSREITLLAIQRFASEHVAENTVKAVRIPSDDLKGRIIGREGRNIRSLEQATGVDIMVDDTPGVISVSCFDPIRRAIAGKCLTKLVADGRINPSKIEQVVQEVKRDFDERIRKKGEDAVGEVRLRGLKPKVVQAMGKMHYRTSYGQNVLRHSIEVAFLSQMIADQLGLDGELARRCGFLHDIGKSMDHELEGTHPNIGMEFVKRNGEKEEAVINAVGGHHGDIPSSTPYTPIVMAADAISGARPGARRESYEAYVKRLSELESIAKESGDIREAYAIQAGREVRVIVDAKKVNDDKSHMMARKIAKRVEEEMTFPGEIKVTVLRQVRAEAIAR